MRSILPKRPKPIKVVSKLVLLVHPYLYVTKCSEYTDYLACENICSDRWKETVRNLSKDTVFLQCGRHLDVYRLAQKSGLVTFRLKRQFVKGETEKGYFVKLASDIVKSLDSKGLVLGDEAIIEGWGESYEGCVTTYTTRIASLLGIKYSICADKCVPDDELLVVRFINEYTERRSCDTSQNTGIVRHFG